MSPTPTPEPIPDIENLPEGYGETIEWDEENLVFILWGLNDEEEETFIGYVDGEWIELTYTEEEVGSDIVETFSYVKNGETIIYYKR